jgi:hypothetical protein
MLSARGTQNLLCARLAGVVLVGVAANAWLGWWWLDPLIGLAVAEAVIPWAVKPGAAKTAADSSADHQGPALRASCSYLTGQAGVVFGCGVPVAPLIPVRVFALCLPRRIWSHQEYTRRGI